MEKKDKKTFVTPIVKVTKMEAKTSILSGSAEPAGPSSISSISLESTGGWQ